MTPTLIDAGPLIAICDVRDPAHAPCWGYLQASRAGFVTTWPVVAEAAYMLRGDRRQIEDLFSLLEQDRFEVAPLDSAAFAWIKRFLTRYTYLKAQVADASLMYLADARGLTEAFTLDRRDFTRYRKADDSVLTLSP